MNKNMAREYLLAPEGKTCSEIGGAVDVLYKEYGTYTAMATRLDLEVSPDYLSTRHRIFQLPSGIQWKINEGKIGITQACEIARLKNEDNQWVLALAMWEENLKVKECKKVVDLALSKNMSIRDALRFVSGINFDKRHTLALPLTFDSRLALYRAAWTQHKEWASHCYDLIRDGGIKGSLEDICEGMKAFLRAYDPSQLTSEENDSTE